MNAAVDLAFEKPGGLQNAKVLGDGGERNSEGCREFADGGLAQGQAGQNGAAGGIGEGAKGGIEGRAGGREIVNHMV